jgi:tetratricopeptide (TPR) repeat protein
VDLLLAQCCQALNNPDQQLAACRRALQGDSSWLPGRRALALCLAGMGKFDDAIEQYGRAQQPPEGRLELARLLFLRNSRLEQAQRDWVPAEKLLQDLPPTGPVAAEAQVLRAEILAAQNRWSEARALAEAERQRDPREVAPWLFLAALAEQQKDRKALVTLLSEAERATGRRAEWPVLRVRQGLRSGVAAAQQALRKVQDELAQYPDTERTRLLRGLGDAFADAGDLKTALPLWREAAGRQPNDLGLRLRLFDAALEEANKDEALRWLGEIRRVEGPGGVLAAFDEAAYQVMLAQSGKKSAMAGTGPLLAQARAQRPSWGSRASAGSLDPGARGPHRQGLGEIPGRPGPGRNTPGCGPPDGTAPVRTGTPCGC